MKKDVKQHLSETLYGKPDLDQAILKLKKHLDEVLHLLDQMQKKN